MILYQIYVFGTDLKSNMAAMVHNVFSLAEILKSFLSETTKPDVDRRLAMTKAHLTYGQVS
jgi:hypothetical protein